MSAEKDIDLVVQKTFFSDSSDGVLIEVGAAKPDYLSIGASFRAKGWKVISIEPNPAFCELHRAEGHEIHQYACSDEDRDSVDFFVVNSQDAKYLDGTVSFESFSSLGIKGKFAKDLSATKQVGQVNTIKVDVRTLDTILATHYPEIAKVDVLAADVEGWELNVVKGFSLVKYSPEVIILENLHKSLSYRTFMWKHGYRRWKRLKPNEIYIKRNASGLELASKLLKVLTRG